MELYYMFIHFLISWPIQFCAGQKEKVHKALCCAPRQSLLMGSLPYTPEARRSETRAGLRRGWSRAALRTRRHATPLTTPPYV